MVLESPRSLICPIKVMFLFAAVLAILCWILLKKVWSRMKYDLHKIPSPPGLPFFGQTLEFIFDKNVSRVRSRWHKQLGRPRIFKVFLFGHHVVYVLDPDCIRRTIASRKDPFPRDSVHDDLMLMMQGIDRQTKGHIVRHENCQYVRTIRHAFMNAFTIQKLSMFISEISRVVDKMIDIIESKRNEGPIEFQELCVRTGLDVIGVIAVECNLGGLDGSTELYQLLIDVGHSARGFFVNPLKKYYCRLFPWSGLAKRATKKLNDLTSEWNRVVDLCMRREPPANGKEPLWYSLKTLINPDTAEPLTYELLRAEIVAAISGGMDTTGHQLSWILGMLATNPNVSNKLYVELCHLKNKQIQLEDLTDLEYLTAVIKEAIRVCGPSLESFVRVAPRDLTIMGYRLPKGTKLSVPGNRWMDNEAEWGDPLVFRPERWINNEVNQTMHYLGFGYGFRDCSGQKLAWAILRYILAKLVIQYEFSTDKSCLEVLDDCKDGLVIEAANGMWLKAIPRKT